MVKTVKVVEYEKQVAANSDFVRDGRVDLYPEAQAPGGVSLSLVKGHLQLQAGGVIGIIPLNDQLVLEVTPRVPVARIEEIIRRSGSAHFLPLPYDRGFMPEFDEFLAVEDLIADRFSSLLGHLAFEGLYKTYSRRRDRGTSPHGRILPVPTLLSLRTSFRPQAHYESFSRTIDNALNRVVLAAGIRLAEILEDKGGRSNRLARTLRALLVMFEGVGPPAQDDLALLPLPAHRPILQQLVELSRLVLSRSGVRFFGDGSVKLPSFLINMERVFEDYVRSILQGNPSFASFEVLDGNKTPPEGARSNIFEVAGPLGNHPTKPDLVIRRDGTVWGVADVKYKPCPELPDRSNLEQVLVYAMAYAAPTALLIYPCAPGQDTGIEFLGRVAGVKCYKATLQLMSENLDEEEAEFCHRTHALLESL